MCIKVGSKKYPILWCTVGKISNFLILFAKEFKSWSSSTLHFQQLPVSFCPLSPNILHSTLSQTTSSCVLPLGSETKFYACTKLQAKLCFCTVMLNVHAHFVTISLFHSFLLFVLLIQLLLLLLNQDKYFIECVRARLFRLYLKVSQLKLFFVSHFYLDVTARDTGNRLEEKPTLCFSLTGLKPTSVQLLVSYFCDWDRFFCSWWDWSLTEKTCSCTIFGLPGFDQIFIFGILNHI